ncbi:hypothetical protein SORBI_3002G132801 [Sorghum bicolor]|uniref:Response regulatory domain-containing protein n=1 Tax=Sorghum bicolor TaxID=4558 RepID=A0A1W0W3Q1_SORBI|nr:hypothetical protein SORBI_3002G132801 [Sorghum bicolor]
MEETFLGIHDDDASTVSVQAHRLQDVVVNLIITDYYMPGMTGYDLFKKIKLGFWSALSMISDF